MEQIGRISGMKRFIFKHVSSGVCIKYEVGGLFPTSINCHSSIVNSNFWYLLAVRTKIFAVITQPAFTDLEFFCGLDFIYHTHGLYFYAL